LNAIGDGTRELIVVVVAKVAAGWSRGTGAIIAEQRVFVIIATEERVVGGGWLRLGILALGCAIRLGSIRHWAIRVVGGHCTVGGRNVGGELWYRQT
jgi:hypothetical protein